MKFIQKSKIVPSSWIEDQRLGNVPLEVYYLSKLDHPNIVKVRICIHFPLKIGCYFDFRRGPTAILPLLMARFAPVLF